MVSKLSLISHNYQLSSLWRQDFSGSSDKSASVSLSASQIKFGRIKFGKHLIISRLYVCVGVCCRRSDMTAILTLSSYKLPTAVHTGLSFLCTWHCRLVSLISCKLLYFLHQLKCYFSGSGCRNLEKLQILVLKYRTLHTKCIPCIQPGGKVVSSSLQLCYRWFYLLFIYLDTGIFFYLYFKKLSKYVSASVLHSRALYGFSLVNLAVVCWMFLIIWSLLSPKN